MHFPGRDPKSNDDGRAEAPDPSRVRGDTELTETSLGGTGFLAATTQAWEAEARRVEEVRLVTLRTSIVLGNDGGALRLMAPLFRLGLGGALGDGRQWMSWIHLRDLAQLALFAIENLDVHGPLNASAPWPARNGDFSRGLAGRRSLSHGAAREAIAAALHEGWLAVEPVPTRVRSTRPPTMPTSPSAGWSH